jgi:hypothetical protein
LNVRNRSVTEIMVLVLTIVVGLAILGFGATVAIIEIRDPAVDTSVAAHAMMTIITSILSALLGIMAGRSETLRARPEPKPTKEDPDA